MNRTHFKPHPPNKEGKTNCVIRWMMETPSGWVGSWDKAALEQFVMPADEPYGWKVTGVPNLYMGEFAEQDAKAVAKRIGGACTAFPLYTRPQPPREVLGLTESKIDDLLLGHGLLEHWPIEKQIHAFVKAIKQASKEKNHE